MLLKLISWTALLSCLALAAAWSVSFVFPWHIGLGGDSVRTHRQISVRHGAVIFLDTEQAKVTDGADFTREWAAVSIYRTTIGICGGAWKTAEDVPYGPYREPFPFVRMMLISYDSWTVPCLALPYPLICLYRHVRTVRHRRHDCCAQCGYPLDDPTAPYCPECGEEFMRPPGTPASLDHSATLRSCFRSTNGDDSSDALRR